MLEELLVCALNVAGAILFSFGFVGHLATEPYPPSPEVRSTPVEELEREWLIIEEANDYLKDL